MRSIRRSIVLLVAALPALANAEPASFNATLTMTFYNSLGTPLPLAPLTASASGMGETDANGFATLPADTFSIGGVYYVPSQGLMLAICRGPSNVISALPPAGLSPCPSEVGGPATTGPFTYYPGSGTGHMQINGKFYPMVFNMGQSAMPLPDLVTGQLTTLTVVYTVTLYGYTWTSGATDPLWSILPFEGHDTRGADGLGELELVGGIGYSIVGSVFPIDGIAITRLTIDYLSYDSDADGVLDSDDNCIFLENPGQEDLDVDGVGDACDNCPRTSNADQLDRGSIGGPTPDGIGDACQNGDFNGDGVVDVLDVSLVRRALAGEEAPLSPSQPPP